MGKQLQELERAWERRLGTEAGGIQVVARESFLCSQEEGSSAMKGQLVWQGWGHGQTQERWFPGQGQAS